MKEIIQPLLDDLVAKHKTVGTYRGVPLEELDKDELLAVIGELGEEMQRTREDHARSMRLMADMCKAGRK